MNAKDRIEKACDKTQEAGIEVTEVWLGPGPYSEILPEIRRDEQDFEWFRELRVRKALEEDVVRAGATSCEFGPGVT